MRVFLPMIHAESKSQDDELKSRQPYIKLIYIAGVGRSGSTVLDSVLGNHPLIQSVGELARLPNDAWIRDYYCACGKRASDCSFWTSVYRKWCRSNGGCSVQEYRNLQDQFEQLRRWPSLILQRRRGLRHFDAYAEQTAMLLGAIQCVSGCSAIVDSSKGVERAHALSLIPNIDLRVIQLVRDPRGVVWSHKKAFARDLRKGLPREIRPQPVWRSALYWCRVNLQAEWLRRYLGPEKSLLVRYEDFVLQTSGVLEQLGQIIGADFGDIQRIIETGKSLHFGHTIAGNRVRMKGKLKLELDQEWIDKLSARDLYTTVLVSGWLMTRYGYEP